MNQYELRDVTIANRIKTDKPFDDFSVECRSVSDGFHTFDELYEHRLALTVGLTRMIMSGPYKGTTCLRSKLHHDGTMFEGGYFIVVIYKPFKENSQISYHYKLEHWDKFTHCIEQDRISIPYDGHTAKDVIERLLRL